MEITLKEIVDFIGGKLIGDEKIVIKNLAKIEEANPGDLTFLYLPAYEKYFPHTHASAILVKPEFKKIRQDISYLEVKDPNKAFFKIVNHFFAPDFKLEGIDAAAFVHPKAKLGKNVSLGRNVVISSGCSIGDNTKIFHNSVLLEDSHVGNDSIIFQNVSIREKCIIGNRVIIHSGSVIGSDGFGFDADENGVFHKIHQIGIVIIEDDVELGANVCVDRASTGATVVKKGVKIDNLVHVAHNVIVGENTAIAAQAGISGSTKVGKNCLIAGQVGIVGHIEIAEKVTLIAQSGVSKGISKPGVYFGSPAKEMKHALRLEGHIRSLPEYAEKIHQLEDKMKELLEKISKLEKS